MKFLQSVALFTFVFTCIFKAEAGDPVWMTNAQKKQNQSVLLNTAQGPKQAVDLCKEYKRKEIAGFILVPVGAGALAGGTVMVYKGINDIATQYKRNTYDRPYQYISSHDFAFVSLGTVLVIASMALIPGGFIMGTNANIKHCKYCRAGGAMNITPSQTGIGLACNF